MLPPIVLPYRTKNPPEHPPYCTIGLIVVNFIIYFCTIGWDFQIRQTVVDCCSVSSRTISPITMVTSMFLHGSPEHIIGNMIFLYIFGAALEGRLRPAKFLSLYFIAGLAGNFAQVLSEVVGHEPIPSYGASGAIMGLVGAYLFVFPHAVIVVFRIFTLLPWSLFFSPLMRISRFGVADWKAWWVVLYYLGFDNLLPVILHEQGGVAYFAHLGGAGAGLLMAMALRTKTDSERISQVQAMRTDVKGDLTLLSSAELSTLLEEPTENMELVTAFCWKSLMDGGPIAEQKCLKMLNKYKLRLLETGDPFKIAKIVLYIPIETNNLPGVFLLKLGGKLESVGGQDDAGLCYRRVFDMNKTAKDAEVALMRLGRLLELHYKNTEQAREAYTVLLTIFPTGLGAEEATKALKRLAPPPAAPAPKPR